MNSYNYKKLFDDKYEELKTISDNFLNSSSFSSNSTLTVSNSPLALPSNSTSATSNSTLALSSLSNSPLTLASNSTFETSNSTTNTILECYYYEVCFKCSSDIYKSRRRYNCDEMVLVTSEHGYNIGFIVREFISSFENFPLQHEDGTTFNAKSIIINLIPNETNQIIYQMLIKKIEIENYAFNQSIYYMIGRPIGQYSEIIGTEFQFDRKKLTIYLKFYQEVSVCYLVRRLHDLFKMRVKVIKIDSPEVLYDRTRRYLLISKLPISLYDIYKKDIQEMNPLSFKQNNFEEQLDFQHPDSKKNSKNKNLKNKYKNQGQKKNINSLIPHEINDRNSAILEINQKYSPIPRSFSTNSNHSIAFPTPPPPPPPPSQLTDSFDLSSGDSLDEFPLQFQFNNISTGRSEFDYLKSNFHFYQPNLREYPTPQNNEYYNQQPHNSSTHYYRYDTTSDHISTNQPIIPRPPYSYSSSTSSTHHNNNHFY